MTVMRTSGWDVGGRSGGGGGGTRPACNGYHHHVWVGQGRQAPSPLRMPRIWLSRPAIWPRAAATVEQTGHGAEQVAQEVAGAGGGDDVEHDLVEVHLEPEQVEVQRPQHEVQDVAGGGADAARGRAAGDVLDLAGSSSWCAARIRVRPPGWW